VVGIRHEYQHRSAAPECRPLRLYAAFVLLLPRQGGIPPQRIGLRKTLRKRAIVVRDGFFQAVAHAAEGDEHEGEDEEVVALHAFRDRQASRNSMMQMAAFMLPVIFPG